MKRNILMIKCLWISALMSISIFSYGQSAVKKVTKEACKFFQKIDLDDISSIDTETVLPKLFGDLSNKYKKRIADELGYDIYNPQHMQEFGELVAVDLLESCEAAKEFFLTYNAINDQESPVEEIPVEEELEDDFIQLNLPDTVITSPEDFEVELDEIFPSSSNEIEPVATDYVNFVGKLIGFEKDYFYYMIVEDFLGNERKFLWADYFEGSEFLLDKQDFLIGKSISVRFKDQDFFNPDFQAYTVKSVIKSVSILD